MGGDRLDQQRVLRDGEGMGAPRLPVPAGDAGKAVGDVLDLDVEGRGVEQVQATAGQHALPGPNFGLLLGALGQGVRILIAYGLVR